MVEVQSPRDIVEGYPHLGGEVGEKRMERGEAGGGERGGVDGGERRVVPNASVC